MPRAKKAKSTTPTQNPLQIDVSYSHDVMKDDTRGHILITLTAPTLARDAAYIVPPAILLDTSGSMGGDTKLTRDKLGLTGNSFNYANRLDVIKFTAKKAIQYLGEQGIMPVIVSFSSRAQTLVAKDQKELQASVDNLWPTGGTNFAYGLAQVPVGTKHVLLFSDGEVNEGSTQPSVLRDTVRGATISTFGLGENRVLSELASLSEGRNYTLSSVEQALAAFGADLSAYTTTVDNSIELEIVIRHSNLQEEKQTIKVGRLLSEQVRSVAVPFILPVGLGTGTHTIGSIRVKQSSSPNKDVTLDLIQARGTRATRSDVYAKVMSVVAEQDAAKAIELATQLADQGRYTESQNILRTAAVATQDMGRQDLAAVTRSFADTYTASSYRSVRQDAVAAGSAIGTQSALAGGRVIAGVDIDDMHMTPAQKKAGALFSITAVDKDDMPDVLSMVTP